MANIAFVPGSKGSWSTVATLHFGGEVPGVHQSDMSHEAEPSVLNVSPFPLRLDVG